MKTRDIQIGKKVATGYEVEVKGANVVVVAAKKGFIACGLFDLGVAEERDLSCAIVREADTIDELLDEEIWGASEKAQDLGIEPGMTGREALKKLF